MSVYNMSSITRSIWPFTDRFHAITKYNNGKNKYGNVDVFKLWIIANKCADFARLGIFPVVRQALFMLKTAIHLVHSISLTNAS